MDLFYVLLVLLAVTRVCGEIAVRVHQPALTGELIGGIVLGLVISFYSDSFPVFESLMESDVFKAITDLAIFFLMLYAGIELRPKDIAQSSGQALGIALAAFLLPLTAGFLLGWYFLPHSGLRLAQSLFLGTALAITAIPVAAKTLIDMDLLDSRIGKTIMSAAIFDDVLSLLLLAVLLAIINTGDLPTVTQFAWLIAKVVGFFAITFGIGIYLVPKLGTWLKRAWVPESEFSALLVAAFAYALLAEAMGLHFILGAFIAGLFFSRQTVDNQAFEAVNSRLSGITSGFLAPIFFASIGLSLDLSAVTAIPIFLVALITIAFAGKMIGAGIPAYFYGMSARDATAVGVGMNGRGAVELILANIAMSAGLFSTAGAGSPIVDNMFSAVVIVAILTTLSMPVLLRLLLPRNKPGPDSG